MKIITINNYSNNNNVAFLSKSNAAMDIWKCSTAFYILKNYSLFILPFFLSVSCHKEED